MTSYCSNCIHRKVCGNEGVDDLAMTYCADKQEERPTAECFTLEELKSWLWQNVLNNSDNTYGESVETLIGRLDGFKRFVEDSRMKGENQ